ncbi:hypothetical protein WJR50_21625 [Catalinimonas sp. 4WD22]|uniref:hypothetical protein n=1 Tax=Catalinimonas locisalis TaxID=3133978 RepID=UPI00310105CA
MNDTIVIPQLSNSIIAKVSKQGITKIGEIDIPFDSKSIVTKNDLVVSLCFETQTLTVHDTAGSLLLEKGDSQYKAINVKGNIVYLGGEYRSRYPFKGEMFSVLNLEDVNLSPTTMDLPIKVVEGKSIDDILIKGSDLILVDNVVYPKYLIKYDISTPEHPTHLETIQLPSGAPNDHIIKGDINEDWTVLFSSASYHGGNSQNISVSGKTEGYLHLNKSWLSIISDDPYSKISYIDFSLVNNYLYVLRSDGLGYIDLNKKISNEDFIPIKTENSNFSRLIKSRSNRLVAVYGRGYELIDTR